MEKKDLEYFEELLINWRSGLLTQAEGTVSSLKDPTDNFADPTDRAAFESDRSFLLRIRDREHKLIGKIDEAFERIEDGTYGICEMCGEAISIERLKARPVTTFCIRCKTKSEAMEKAIGF
ncbi:RNA polymerase-binding protein DksA [Desulfobacteraceae bacterium SEEP-SAG9]|nr:RNA polymerase-binding protein DksA [Desulfobacteraceae bacterium SEEP-SAG9]